LERGKRPGLIRDWRVLRRGRPHIRELVWYFKKEEARHEPLNCVFWKSRQAMASCIVYFGNKAETLHKARSDLRWEEEPRPEPAKNPERRRHVTSAVKFRKGQEASHRVSRPALLERNKGSHLCLQDQFGKEQAMF
jgi:hypothetical protein